MDLAAYLEEKRRLVDAALDRYLPPETAYPPRIHQAMRYSLFAGGKRLRPILVLMASEVCGGSEDRVLPAACAVELVHTYSLIHDDLPAMDDDDLRRGRPTCHRAFDEATAILAGDALLSYAFWLLAHELPRGGVSEAVTVAVIEELAEAAGVRGLIAGQVADLAAEGRRVDEEELTYIHRHKTASLFVACLRIGGRLGGAGERELEALEEFGLELGLAFQIVDDILDVTGEVSKLGKEPGSDQRREKATFPALLGLEGARRRGREATERALVAAERLGPGAWRLRELALYLLGRDR
ncbi:MAG: polyprenyl synthetase family protein [Moorellales bacterium]